MAAIQDISQQLNGIGIKVSPIYPPANARTSDQANGTYDMAIDNNVGASSDPWSYFHHVYQLPIGGASNEEAAGLNMERFSDPAAWALVEKASTTPSSDTAALDGLRHTREGLPPGPARDPAVVQRRLVPGQQHLLDGLPLHHQPHRPEHPGLVEWVPRGHDDRLRPGCAPARRSWPANYNFLHRSRGPPPSPGRWACWP